MTHAPRCPPAPVCSDTAPSRLVFLRARPLFSVDVAAQAAGAAAAAAVTIDPLTGVPRFPTADVHFVAFGHALRERLAAAAAAERAAPTPPLSIANR